MKMAKAAAVDAHSALVLLPDAALWSTPDSERVVTRGTVRQHADALQMFSRFPAPEANGHSPAMKLAAAEILSQEEAS